MAAGAAGAALPPLRALVLAVLMAVLPAGPSAAAASAPALASPRRALLQYPFAFDAYDRRPMAGWAKGKRAGGQPNPVMGLAEPDRPSLGPKSASMEDLVLPYGYPLETYPVETEDGWILRMYRIPYGVQNSTRPHPNKPVVLLHHGVTLASSCFVVLDPDSSMGFYLADAGFDVWMANTRANTYSRGNRYYRHTDEGYWHHTMDDLALIDLPAQIDYALKISGQKQLAVIGHSQGCTLPEMLLAAKPEYNDKLWLLMLLGAVTFADKIRAPYLSSMSKFSVPQFLMSGSVREFAPNRITSQMVSGCGTEPGHAYCSDLINFLFYGPSTVVSPDDLPRVSATWASSVSMRNLAQWSQMYHKAKGLVMYDFGTNCTINDDVGARSRVLTETCNQAKYGQDEPPEYDLSKVTARAAVFEGDHDLMATHEDVTQLLSSWRADVAFQKMYPNTAHMDFVWARAPIFKQDIIDVLWKYAPRVAGSKAAVGSGGAAAGKKAGGQASGGRLLSSAVVRRSVAGGPAPAQKAAAPKAAAPTAASWPLAAVPKAAAPRAAALSVSMARPPLPKASAPVSPSPAVLSRTPPTPAPIAGRGTGR